MGKAAVVAADPLSCMLIESPSQVVWQMVLFAFVASPWFVTHLLTYLPSLVSTTQAGALSYLGGAVQAAAFVGLSYVLGMTSLVGDAGQFNNNQLIAAGVLFFILNLPSVATWLNTYITGIVDTTGLPTALATILYTAVYGAVIYFVPPAMCPQ